MSRSHKLTVFAFCVLVAVVQGWIVLKFHSIWGLGLLYLGVVGAIPFLMLNGVHGDVGGATGVIGGILFVLTNGAVYYGCIALFRKLRRRRRR